MENKALSVKRAILIGGACVAFLIGSGFATGQEVMQFFAAHGLISVLGIILFLILNIYVCFNYIIAGRKGKFEKGTEVFRYFCGKYIGTFYDYFAVLFCFMIFVVMVAGAGASLHQHYGIPVAVGGILIAVLSCLSVVFGLQKLIDIVGTIGPVIIILAIAGSIIGLINATVGVGQGNQMVSELNVMAASKNWFSSALSYAGFGMLMVGGFFAAIGNREARLVDAKRGAALGIFVFCITVCAVMLSVLANIDLVAESQIPLLAIINNSVPVLATIYTVVIFLGIYTTAAPLLWTVSNRLAPERTKKYILITIALTAAGCIVGLALPFNKLLNIIYPINGYIGFILLAFIVVRNIRDLIKKKQTPAKSAAEEISYDEKAEA